MQARLSRTQIEWVTQACSLTAAPKLGARARLSAELVQVPQSPSATAAEGAAVVVDRTYQFIPNSSKRRGWWCSPVHSRTRTAPGHTREHSHRVPAQSLSDTGNVRCERDARLHFGPRPPLILLREKQRARGPRCSCSEQYGYLWVTCAGSFLTCPVLQETFSNVRRLLAPSIKFL